MYFNWDGRTMTSANTMSTDYVFTYYENGLRKTKTDVQGMMSYEYVYDGTTLVMETFVDLYTILYIYDANGSPIGFRFRWNEYASGVWDVYWYEKNPFGDIVAIYSSTGQKLISYEYDPWGNFTTTNHTGASTTARYNSLKYRGYYYDDDFNMYYLQSRYYDPATCRFISPDSLMSGVNGNLHGFNLYAYCFNNPISFTDSQGNWPSLSDLYEWYEEGKEKLEEFAEEVKEKAYDVYYNATEWHFEGREEKNGEHPSYSEVNEKDSGWYLLPENQSIYHDNGVGNPELKYITSDGREAVFDGDTLNPVTDPNFIATYNYCPVYQITPGESYAADYVKFAGSAIGHFFADMLPYYLTGNSNTREQFESKFSFFD